MNEKLQMWQYDLWLYILITLYIFGVFLCTFYWWCFFYVFFLFGFSISICLCCGLSSGGGITSYTRAHRDVHTLFLALRHCLHVCICFILFAIYYSFGFCFVFECHFTSLTHCLHIMYILLFALHYLICRYQPHLNRFLFNHQTYLARVRTTNGLF